MNRHAWLQKHPTPQASRGEFHWYPEAPDAGERELRAGFVERLRGIEPPAVLWQIEPGRVAWGQVFSATASDGRRYVGLVLSVVEGDRASDRTERPFGLAAGRARTPSVDELLDMLALPPAAPWGAGDPVATSPWLTERNPLGWSSAPVGDDQRGAAVQVVADAAPARAIGSSGKRGARRPRTGGALRAESARRDTARALESPDRARGARELSSVLRTNQGDAAGVARALLVGGTARVGDPASADLPCWIASIERVMPATTARRCGVWTDGAGAKPDGADGALERVAALAAAAWREPGSRAADGWTLLCEIAAARGEPVERVGAALVLDPSSVLTAAERAELPGTASAVDVLHAWGRGRFDRSSTADSLTERLADLVVLRVLARLASGDDGGAAIAEARWHALLPAQRRTALLAAVAGRTASLRALVEGHHA